MEELVTRYRVLKKQLRSRLRTALREKAEQVGSAVEELKTADPKRAWESLRRLTGLVSSKPVLCAVVDAEGKEHVGEAARALVQVAFQSLGLEDLDDEQFDAEFAARVRSQVRRAQAERIDGGDLDTQFSLAEVEAVQRRLQTGKANGPDEVLAELLKHGGKKMTRALWTMLNLVWLSEKCPEEWGRGAIALLYKDGDTRDPLNYRGITLLSVVAKFFAALLNDRLSAHLEREEQLGDEQAGFRKGRACIDHIFSLREVLSARAEAHVCMLFGHPQGIRYGVARRPVGRTLAEGCARTNVESAAGVLRPGAELCPRRRGDDGLVRSADRRAAGMRAVAHSVRCVLRRAVAGAAQHGARRPGGRSG